MSHKKHDSAHNEPNPKAEQEKSTQSTDDALITEKDMTASVDPSSQSNETSKKEDDPVSRLEKELHQANDRVLRTLAELENYRKRAARELEDVRKYAGINLIRDMLSVWDNMGRALEAVEKTHDIKSLTEGVQMMHEQFLNVLHQHHCAQIDAIGLPFDPNVHESIIQMPSPEQEPGTILFESQTGFKLYDRVVRPTQVVIAGPNQ